jgi:hypothetical protein
MNRNWYHKDDGNTVLWGEPEDMARNYPTAILIPSERPSPMHFWNTKTQCWHIPKHLKLSKSDKRLIPAPERPSNRFTEFLQKIFKSLEGLMKLFSKKKDKDKKPK